ncbi:MAG TPA: pyridoxamine 5'-phosphate oxidase family protein [Acidimicrobiia bacterium]
MLSDHARELLGKKTIAHVAVVDDRGRPHSTPVWVDVVDGRVLVNTAEGRVKDRYLREGAPVAISAVDPDNPYDSVQVRGRVVERRTDGADDDIDALAEKYLDEETYPLRRPGEVRVTVLVEPE